MVYWSNSGLSAEKVFPAILRSQFVPTVSLTHSSGQPPSYLHPGNLQDNNKNREGMGPVDTYGTYVL